MAHHATAMNGLRPRIALPDGLAPVGPLRDRQAERRRALATATNRVRESVGAVSKWEFTSLKKGEATAAYKELAATAKSSGRKRRAVKNFFGRLFAGLPLSAYAVASFLAEPEKADPALEGTPIDELCAALEEDGVSGLVISTARVSVLPYLVGQTPPGVDSTERPK